MSANISDLMGLVKKVFNSQSFAVLSSAARGQPYSNLVAFAFTNDLKSIFFVTNRNTRKYKNIQTNKRISMLIDNRTNKKSDLNKAIAITVIGSAREELNENDYLKLLFLTRYPTLKQFLNDPDNALIVINVQEYIIASFNRIQRIVINLE